MKHLCLLSVVLLAGCQTLSTPATEPVVTKPVAAPAQPAAAPVVAVKPKPIQRPIVVPVAPASSTAANIDERCQRLARYARSVAALRIANVPLETTNYGTSDTKDTSVPLSVVRTDVYARKDLDQEQIHELYLTRCTVGYDKFIESLISDHAKRKPEVVAPPKSSAQLNRETIIDRNQKTELDALPPKK